MACDRQPLLLCTTFHSFLCTVHYFLCAFSAKMATYSLVIDNVYFVYFGGGCFPKRTRAINGGGGSQNTIILSEHFLMSPNYSPLGTKFFLFWKMKCPLRHVMNNLFNLFKMRAFSTNVACCITRFFIKATLFCNP